MTLPPACAKPCNDCPWRRASAPGWLGPMGPLDWLRAADSDLPIACHQTIVTEGDSKTGEWDHPDIRQCQGAATFRANTFKEPRNAEVACGPSDRDSVFASKQEFYEHHGGEGELNVMDMMQPIGTPEGESVL